MTKKPQIQKPPKKTVSIEVRISEEDKTAFMAACHAANRSASQALRGLMRVFVGFHSARQRMLETMTHLISKPLRLTAAALTGALALTSSLLLAPMASADMTYAYQVVVDDGIGQIVSMGETLDGEGPIADSLGPGVRFELVTLPCGESEMADCESAELRLTVSELSDGEIVRELIHGVAVSDTDSTRYEAELGDGRTLRVHVAPRA